MSDVMIYRESGLNLKNLVKGKPKRDLFFWKSWG